MKYNFYNTNDIGVFEVLPNITIFTKFRQIDIGWLFFSFVISWGK